jgi:hypothetical protein
MSDQAIPSAGGLIIPTVSEIPALGGTPNQPLGQPQPIAARGGSVINNGTVTVFLSSGFNPLDINAIALQPGGSVPWPQGVACWAWALPGSGVAGSVIVMPLQLPYSPGGLGGQPVTIVNVNNIPVEAMTMNTVVAGIQGNGGPILNPPPPGKAYRIGTFSAAVGTVPEVVELIGSFSGATYRAVALPTALGNVTCPTSGPDDIIEGLNVFDVLNSQNIQFSLTYRIVDQF